MILEEYNKMEVSKELQDIRQIFTEKVSRRKLLSEQLSEVSFQIKEGEQQIEYLEKARWLLTEASRLTQEKLKGKIESLVTLAIQGVYNKPQKFLVDFEIQRDKSECLLRIQEGDKEPYIPKDEKGCGLLDVISFALRVVLWSMDKEPSRNVFILDEPGKWTGALIGLFGQMIKEISKQLNIQIIMVTHDPELIDVADRAWQVTHNGEYSEVALSGGEVKMKRRK